MLRATLRRLFVLATAAFLPAAGCGNLDDVTTVKDLRVLAVKSEPAGFFIDLERPELAQPEATVTALVVDPLGGGGTVTFTARGCPDYIDTITSATGKGSKLCPDTDPMLVGTPLETKIIYPDDMPGSATPTVEPNVSPIEYAPAAAFGLTAEQLKVFFAKEPTGNALVDQSVAYNRDFGLAAIVNFTFTLGAETALAIKRVVYWPRITCDGLPDPQPNQNPALEGVHLYKVRNETTGLPENELSDEVPTRSLAAGDKLFVDPVPMPGAKEPYCLRLKNMETDQIETRFVERELLTYQFYATAGTFSPATRQSELSPIFTSPDGMPRTDSQYNLPDAADVPAEGLTVKIWVVVRDERAGTEWKSRVIRVVP